MIPLLLAAEEAAVAETSLLPPVVLRALVCPTFWGLVLGALGLLAILPQTSPRKRTLGGVLLALAGGLLASDFPWLADWAAQGMFWFLALVALGAAVGTISAQSPVYSAIWFALSLLGTAGLFFLNNAQFLAVATIVVYAGAIVVTFLFVIMLAQPEGHSSYDRISWGFFPKAVSVLAAATLVGLMTFLLGGLKQKALAAPVAVAAVSETKSTDETKPTAEKKAAPPIDPMAELGGYLFTRHLLSIELAGTLLLAGLVGAVAIAIQGKQRDPLEEAIRS